jgi:hypothetical protein
MKPRQYINSMTGLQARLLLLTFNEMEKGSAVWGQPFIYDMACHERCLRKWSRYGVRLPSSGVSYNSLKREPPTKGVFLRAGV